MATMSQTDVHAGDHPFTVDCLAIAPGRLLMSETSAATLARLETEGVEVLTLPYDAVTSSGGGIHCSTAPLLRDAP